MTDYLYGFTPADVAGDAAGNVLPGRKAMVYTSFAGDQVYMETKSADGLVVGPTTGGEVEADAKGRVVFYAPTRQTLWVDWNDGTRWPVNPAEASVATSAEVTEQTTGLVDQIDQAVADAAVARAVAAGDSEASRLLGALNGTASVDARTAVPSLAVRLQLSSNNVIQAAVRLRETGEWFVSQATTGTVAGRETTVIDRLRPDGTLLDTMIFPDAGHGVYISVEQIDGSPWVWFRYMRYSGTTAVSGDVVRVRWAPGTFDPATAGAGMQTVFTVGPAESFQCVVDTASRRLCTFISGRYRLYGLDDCLANGRNAKQIGVDVVPNIPGSTGQGVALSGSTVYRYTGADNTSNAAAEHKLLGAYSFNTGESLYVRDLNDVLPIGEPEGAFIYFDGLGLPTLYLGVSTGPGGARTSYVYSVRSGLAAGPVNVATQDVQPAEPVAAANLALINAALMAGNVVLPPGTVWVNDAVRVPSYRTLSGAGMGRTWLKMIDGVASNTPVVTNLSNLNVPRTVPDVQLRIADLSIDGNRKKRNSDPQVNENGCALRLSCVEHALVERVYAVNGTHSFDAAASVYMDGSLALSDPNKRPPGPSRWVTFRDCVAGGSDDDAFTTHDSQYISYINCRAINHESKPRDGASNGFEIDDGSQDVLIEGCYAYGFRYGVEVKGHAQNIPARRVGVLNTTADSCDYGFGIFWDSYATDPTLPTDVWLKGCQSINNRDVMGYDAGFGYSYHNSITIGGYSHVTVDDFVVRDTPFGNIHLYNGASNIRIRSVVGENVWSMPYSTRGFVHVMATAGDDIQIKGVELRKLSGVGSVVGVQATAPCLVEDIKAAGTAPAAWQAGKAYAFGQQVSLPGGETLTCAVVGTSGAAAPAAPARGATVVDGSVTWRRQYSAAVMMTTDTAQILTRRVTQTGYEYGAYVATGANSGGYAQAPIVTGWWA